MRGRFVAALRFAHLGSAAEGAALLAPMRAVAPAVMDLVDEMPYSAVDAVHRDPTDPMPIWDRGTALSDLTADTVDALLAAAGPDVVVPLTMVEIRLLGGAIARQPEVPDAVTGRDAAFSVYTLGVIADRPVEHVAAATAAIVEAVRPWSCRGPVNMLGQAGRARVGLLWNATDRARLLRIRDRYDPAGVFATNVVIG